MKLGLFAIILVIAGCAPAQPYRSGSGTYGGSTGVGTGSGGANSQAGPANSFSQDAVECERTAAFAGIGSKGEAFSKCMRARGHTPGR